MFQLEELTQHAVFAFFKEISDIPRESGNEKQVSDYLVAFANERGLTVIQDEALNVIIKKAATPGYENAPTVILQGHMDMVCELNKGTVHNFERDPISWRIDGDMLYANGTTLGADNGIAVAYALALLDAKDVAHPALEVIITTEEETTMGGAIAVEPSHFTGKIFINLDTEEEGKLLVSSAGGVKGKLNLPIIWEHPPHGEAYRILIGGLRGGHSGMEINKERGNANKLLGRLLHDLSHSISYTLGEINGGLKSNAIPREAEAIVVAEEQDVAALTKKVDEWHKVFHDELRASDPGIYVKLEKTKVERVFSKETTKAVVQAIMLTPNGVQSMSLDIDELVVSSTNLGVITTSDTEVSMQNEIRSSVKSLKEQTLQQIKIISELLGGTLETKGDYPEWPYNPDSPIRELCKKVYREKYGKEAEIIAIHAGIECGIFTEKMSGLDTISLGPNMYDVHTPNEHLDIPSTIRTWEYLLAILEEMNHM
ncbi:aminoacyl-histidine dipeptidase [Ectobacillus antri]|uniref:Aminoacyl-histidine dipeptidase n=1 Tax=Ectobacillus antri TaxID=2486280 RepID=A0ABT6H553_9BACI|nr:aminoacyl-histidine dipeptidase [Ectobacillus antri]MDG4657078.1 aminoacyl-histidine dipeptidase [Ectobacillus antri]MDG5754180.1 aminoacyl-histidine dipeptidase [Ectobacillus antri]